MTAEQIRLVASLRELAAAGDWRGLVALEKEALALARELRGANPEAVSTILNMLGVGERVLEPRDLLPQHGGLWAGARAARAGQGDL